MKQKANISIFFEVAILVSLFLFPLAGQAYSLNTDTLVSLTNDQRAEHQLPALKRDSALDAIAKAKAHSIFATQEFAHDQNDKPFFSFFDNAKYHYEYAGENLAIDYFNEAETIQAFMDSPTHRANILDKRYTNTGIAVMDGVINKEYTIVVVQLFSKPSALPAPATITPSATSLPRPNAAIAFQGIAYAAAATVLLVVRKKKFSHQYA